MKHNTTDVWDVFLDLHDKGKLSKDYWKKTPKFQVQITDYLKSIIDAGVTDGKTSIPYDFSYYLFHLPEEMVHHLGLYAENILKSDPDNGAAVQFIAIITFQMAKEQKPLEQYSLIENAMLLTPNDIEICFYAYTLCTWGGDKEWIEFALISVERLLERLRTSSDDEKYQWVSQLYNHYDVLTKPTEFYNESRKDPVLMKRWGKVLNQLASIFKTQLTQDTGAQSALIGLAEIYETLGNIAEAQAVLEKRIAQDPKDVVTLEGLAKIYEKLGESELSREYKIKANPSLGWVNEILPDFPKSTVDLDGNPISLLDYRGKVVLLDFWAVWCGPCVGEIPNVKAVYQKYHDKGFEVIGISLDQDESILRQYIKDQEIPWRQIQDSKSFDGIFANQYNVNRIPSPYLINRDGRVISVDARDNQLNELVEAEIARK